MVPILKPAKPGAPPPDKASPRSYRTIAISNLVMKILSVVLLNRLSHWAAYFGHVPPEQAGFMSGRSSEEMVWSLTETIRARLRSGPNKTIAVGFIDFERAYDSLDHDLLFAVLARLGLPPRFLGLLRRWAAHRTVRIRVNGSLSDPFPINRGLAQGCSLSPLIFSLFLASLSHYLDSVPEITGCSVLGQILKRFIYADDIAIVADDAASLQTALSHVHEWATAFGLTINMGVGKTEAIFFTSGLTLAAATPALQLTCGGKRVNWATSYLYLGHPLRFDLSEREAAAGRLSDMASAYGCYFLRNRLIRRMPNMSQLQVLKTCVLGGANYLRGVRHMTAEDHAAYDAMALTAARRILGLPDNCSTALVWTLSGLMPSAAITAQARWALNCKTRRACVVNTPAAAIMTGLRNEAAAARANPRGAKQRRPRANADRTASWLATEDKAREGYATLLGLPVLQLPGAVTHVARGIANPPKCWVAPSPSP